MKHLIVGGLAALMAMPAAMAEQNAETEAVLSEMADTFARGFYARDPSMVLSVVHPELSKIGVWQNFRGSGQDITEELPPGTLEVLGRIYNADGRLHPVTSTVGTDFYDSTDNVGLFMLTADRDWYDIFVGTQINGEWVLVNCAYGGYSLIDNPDRDADMADVRSVVETYARGFDIGDYAQVLSRIYPNMDRRHVVRGGEREYLQQETLETVSQQLAIQGDAGDLASLVTVFDATQRTAAARIDAADRTEWVLLQRLNDEWLIVNSLWEEAG